MPLRRHLPVFNRQRLAHVLAVAGVCACGLANAETPTDSPVSPSQPDPVADVAAAQTPIPSGQIAADTSTAESDIELSGPANSTLELRVARRPWLLQKLTGSKDERSHKMNPPRPPVDLPDPPSMSRIMPQVGPTYADLKQLNPEFQLSADPSHSDVRQPLRDPEPVSAKQSQSSKVITGNVEPPRSDASSVNKQIRLEPSGSESEMSHRSAESMSSEEAGVAVRELSIQADGSPANSNALAASEPGDSPEPSAQIQLERPNTQNAGSVRNELAAEVGQSAENGPTDRVDDDLESQYVGDIDEHDVASEATAESESLADEVTDLPPLDYVGVPKQPFVLTRNSIRMKGMMQQCLRYYYNRPEIANKRSNWGMMHSIMVYGIDTKVVVGRKKYSAIAWIAGNNACRGQKILTEQDGKLTAKNGVGLQGHQAQLLAVFSLAGVPADYTLYAGDTAYKVDDLIEAEKLACKKGEELTFTLIGLAHYLETESKWTNAEGEAWDFEKLIREELSQPIVGAACGGTHRLMGFAHALRARRAEGLPITGQWKRAEQYVNSFVQYTYRLQNRDGSMSTDWFEGRENGSDLDRKIQTTGHMVEWLLTVTPDSQLQNPRLVSSVRFLLNSMYRERDKEWSIGPKGHALRSIAMYYERVYQSGPAWRTQAIAGRHSSRQR